MFMGGKINDEYIYYLSGNIAAPKLQFFYKSYIMSQYILLSLDLSYALVKCKCEFQSLQGCVFNTILCIPLSLSINVTMCL